MANFKAYRFETIREIADQVRKDHTRDANGIPVNVERIIEISLKMNIIPVYDLKSHLEMEAMLSKDLKQIFIDEYSFNNPNLDNRTRFSLAHELGHYFLHKDFYKEVKFSSPEEWIDVLRGLDPAELEWYEKHADEFAGRLLVPLTPLQQLTEQNKEFIQLQEHEAIAKGIKDNEELLKWKRFSLASRICTKFNVSSKTMEIRLRREKIQI